MVRLTVVKKCDVCGERNDPIALPPNKKSKGPRLVICLKCFDTKAGRRMFEKAMGYHDKRK